MPLPPGLTPYQLKRVLNTLATKRQISVPDINQQAVDTSAIAAGAVTAAGTVTDNTSQSIGASDVTIASFSITVHASSDIVTVSGRTYATLSGYSGASSPIITMKLKRGATTVDTANSTFSASSGDTIGGQLAAPFALYDTGVSGAQTYNVTMAVASGPTLTKTSCMAVAIDHKR